MTAPYNGRWLRLMNMLLVLILVIAFAVMAWELIFGCPTAVVILFGTVSTFSWLGAFLIWLLKL